jgi:hypothetical protein
MGRSTCHSLFLPAEGPHVEGQVLQTNDEAKIHAHWEAAHGELMREWKCPHRETVENHELAQSRKEEHLAAEQHENYRDTIDRGSVDTGVRKDGARNRKNYGLCGGKHGHEGRPKILALPRNLLTSNKE